jgi:hypothetical protein
MSECTFTPKLIQKNSTAKKLQGLHEAELQQSNQRSNSPINTRGSSPSARNVYTPNNGVNALRMNNRKKYEPVLEANNEYDNEPNSGFKSSF